MGRKNCARSPLPLMSRTTLPVPPCRLSPADLPPVQWPTSPPPTWQTEPNTEHYAAGMQGKTPARGTAFRILGIGTYAPQGVTRAGHRRPEGLESSDAVAAQVFWRAER